ncbi:MAG: hypothetical protein ACPG8W_13740 [Candidatus Promineifilaceae bacterium]
MKQSKTKQKPQSSPMRPKETSSPSAETGKSAVADFQFANARIPLAQRQAAALQLNRMVGNRRAQQLFRSPSSQIHRQDGESNLATLREMLGRFDIPEDQVINLLPSLNAEEKQTVVTEAWFKTRMVAAFDWGEMVRAMANLNPSLQVKLSWLDAAATATSAISYDEIKPFITTAPVSERQELTTEYWKSFFLSVCTNSTILDAVNDLKLPLSTQLQWISDEVESVLVSISYGDIQQLVKNASQTDRDALKVTEWRDFFMAVCDNETIVTAVKDLNFDLQTRLEWILEEGNAGNLFGGLDATQIYEALKDDLTGEALELVELASLNNWDAEDETRIRELMDTRNDRPEHEDTLGEDAQELSGPAGELIENHTTVMEGHGAPHRVLSVAGLAAEASGLMQSDPALVLQVLNTVASMASDNIALAILETNVTDELLQQIAQDASGRDLLLAMVRILASGANTGGEEAQQERVLQAISDADAATREESGETTEVEIITFLYGGEGLDGAGEVLGSYRGHTAIVVGDLVYSFEMGWQCGDTKASYLARENNIIRDGIGQTLTVTEEDAQILQENLNASCGTGAYFASGDICTGKTSLALENALHQGLYEVENPQLFVGYLESTGLVNARHQYPKQK